MGKYRKKPVVIEAMEFIETQESADALEAFVMDGGGSLKVCQHGFIIDTLEDLMLVTSGDWIIKGVAGEFYPCKPEIFAASYESVG